MLTNLWIASSGAFYFLVYFLKYLPGDTYITAVAIGFSCLGYMTTDYGTRKLGLFTNLVAGYGTIAILATIVIILNIIGEGVSIFTYVSIFFIIKFLVCHCYSGLYVVHIELFDSGVLSSSYGICGLVSKFVNMSISMLCETKNKVLPLLVFMAINLLASFASKFL